MAIIDFPEPVPPEDDGYPPPPPFDDNPVAFAPEDVPPLSDAELAALEQQQEQNRAILAREAADVEPSNTGYSSTGPIGGTPYDDDGNLNPGWTLDENNNPVYVGGGFVEPATAASAAQSREQAFVKLAQQQATQQARINQPSSADWRVRLQLAPNATYLYKASTDVKQLGILAPLAATDGVIFPYTPQIETSYQAKYQTADLVHSNYRGYFYTNSYVDNINIRGTFTAQDTFEASYLLAVIHFFRTVTKMFYGQDPQAGTPPPVVFLSGLGQYQFNKHPCVVSNFTYSLPKDVDYIRANGFNNIGLNLENRRDKSSGPAMGGVLGFLTSKLGINNLSPGGVPKVPSPGIVNQNTNTTSPVNSTYVPTKMEISISLLPIQTRNQVSQQFSVKNFANGNLLRDGFW